MVFFSYWNQYVGIYWLRGTRVERSRINKKLCVKSYKEYVTYMLLR